MVAAAAVQEDVDVVGIWTLSARTYAQPAAAGPAAARDRRRRQAASRRRGDPRRRQCAQGRGGAQDLHDGGGHARHRGLSARGGRSGGRACKTDAPLALMLRRPDPHAPGVSSLLRAQAHAAGAPLFSFSQVRAESPADRAADWLPLRLQIRLSDGAATFALMQTQAANGCAQTSGSSPISPASSRLLVRRSPPPRAAQRRRDRRHQAWRCCCGLSRRADVGGCAAPVGGEQHHAGSEDHARQYGRHAAQGLSV